ncbi:MAG: rRNA pseudouridine synthase [Oscillospiraceae bacterium]|nr:rRNA pseudouridine synthase [Oscillospiraceae bacterium]
MEQRLQKLIASAGLCSRRTAEDWIRAGRVAVNGVPALLGQSADPENDAITVDGRTIVFSVQKIYLMLNKPRGYVCTMSDEKGRKTVSALVEGCGARVVPVGRLDMDSQGLLLMTNDGEWMQRILHPKYEIDKVYRVTVVGEVSGAKKKLEAMRELDSEPIRPARVNILRSGLETAEFEITIHEGRNRQIRRMCEAAGMRVKKLIRIAEHNLELGDLPEGKWRALTERELMDFEKK